MNFWLKFPLFEEAGEGAGGGATTTTTTTEQPDYAAQIAALTAERDAAKAAAKEHEDSAKFWHGKARGQAEAPAAVAAREEEDNTDLLEVAAKGPKAMKEWMEKQGFVSKADVDRIANEKVTIVTREQRLIESYPDLKDQKSDFFKDTANEYGNLLKMGVPEHVAMELAAERVGSKRNPGTGGEPKKPDTAEAQRLARVKAQGGEGTKRQAARASESDSDELDDVQRRVAQGFGITEDAYKKRAKDGVQYAGKL